MKVSTVSRRSPHPFTRTCPLIRTSPLPHRFLRAAVLLVTAQLFFALLPGNALQYPEVDLSVSKGKMTLHWKVENPGKKDYVALFDGVPEAKGPNGYLLNQWQWATRNSPYVTGTAEGHNYYVAYVSEDSKGNRKILASAGPYNCLDKGMDKGQEYLQALNKCLEKRYKKKVAGRPFGLSQGNALPASWIAQTPNVWGKSAGDVRQGSGSFIAEEIKHLIAGAEHFIDIATLAQYPDGAFHQAIVDGLLEVAKSGRKVTVRVLAGWHPAAAATSDWTKTYLDKIAGPVSKIKGNKMSFYVAGQRHTLATWNNSKIVAADGKAVLLGGQNLWAKDYLGPTPVHDLNVKLEGPAAYDSHKYLDYIWSHVCMETNPYWMPWSWKHGEWMDHRKCLAESKVRKTPGRGKVAVLGVGRYGTMRGYFESTEPSDHAMLLAMNASESVMRIAQQDLGFSPGNLYWKLGMRAIADALLRNVEVFIVLSNSNSKVGDSEYSLVSVKQTAKEIKSYLKARSDKTDREINDILCASLNLATLRFGPSEKWSNGRGFANHSKFLMFDEWSFYVGSANLYPSNLAEYGVFISDEKAVRDMKAKYYDRLWSYSKRTAISGRDAKKCYFKNP